MKSRTVKQRKSGCYQTLEMTSEYTTGAWIIYSTFLNLSQFHKSKLKLGRIILDIFLIEENYKN